ncbi:NAD-dependent succinate-semialdehyde dehydrogenase [Pseudorhodoferax soli]|uniref:Succinate-semialdehyde dehydrogenase/glutarate-semialdehyde dehydrogenase n=1 Tax=Pseudorhodoferax soli TaxID=545864 RepID=A0A368X7P5_9BURK|nr:NAD-dependent succinate-semialdehyde dehydrogenase [Pseudorhodoferax soli]RCW63216.1 succinate-semialdehyde dehydrogenase/glutarate-semialdehyde dehydrogenase [Pseudorhodoferax soli]
MSYPNTELLINGRFCAAADGRTLEVVNPATGKSIGTVAHASTEDLQRAALAARAGFETWRKMPAYQRGRIMRDAAGRLRANADETARLLTLEQGKPLAEARGEIDRSADIVEWFSEEATRVYGRIVPARDSATRNMVVKDPVGPVAAFTPWNFPINQIVRKVCGALAAGCSIVVKAPEETPAAPAALIRAFVEAGCPEGVIGLVYGVPSEISEYLIAHPAIRKISFTGSTAVGKQLAALAGSHMKRVTMELGGHAPVIVAEDADLALAVRAAGGTKFRNAGQVCVAPTRFLVHDAVADEFAAALARHAAELRVGDGLDAATQMGPLANTRRVSAMRDLTSDAVDRGAKLLTGGASGSEGGNFWQPTVLADVPLDARVFNEEPFGPVAAIRRFSTLDDAIGEANRLPYGLAGYAFTRSLSTAHRLSQDVAVGMLWINQGANAFPELPFVGVGDSGYGSEGGPEAVEAYLNTRLVSSVSV